MSKSQGRGKGKVTTGKRKRGESSGSILDILHDDSWRERNFTPQEKADQLEPTLGKDPQNSRRTPAVHLRSDQTEWFFLERNLTEVNSSWVREFYSNYFLSSLDAVQLRGKQILVTKEAIEEILHLSPKSDQPDCYQKAEKDMRFM
ncbi:hypothetical protein HN51_028255, partial [Arachis hypogaea]